MRDVVLRHLKEKVRMEQIPEKASLKKKSSEQFLFFLKYGYPIKREGSPERYKNRT